MKNELTVLHQLKDVIENNLNDYLAEGLSPITSDNVLLKFPNPDDMPKRVMFYIVPDWAEYENLATTNDSVEFHVTIFILCKRAKHIILEEEVYGYYNALYELLRRDMTLGSYVDFTEIDSANFYSAVDASETVTGTEVAVTINYTKDFE